MNHNAMHCDDYKVNKCPTKCYRAQLGIKPESVIER